MPPSSSWTIARARRGSVLRRSKAKGPDEPRLRISSGTTAAKSSPSIRLGLTWCSQKILLDEIDAAMAQDVVCRGDVKKELRRAESKQKGLAGKSSLRTVPKRENHFSFARIVDLSRPQTPDEIYRGCDTRLEFWNVRLGIWKYRRGGAGQQKPGQHSHAQRTSHLHH